MVGSIVGFVDVVFAVTFVFVARFVVFVDVEVSASSTDVSS